MRIATIAFACTLALAPALQAQDSSAAAPLALSPGGAGDALFLPYWAVDEDTSTLLSVANTRDQAKAVRVTLVGAADAQPVFSFTLYLAPHDRYEAALVAGAGGGLGVELASEDGSCTLPQAAADTAPAPQDPPAGEAPPTVPGGEGTIEIVELGVLAGDEGSVPALTDCAALAAAFADGGAWSADANAGLGAPDGGLTASVEVVHEDEATVAAFPATAFSGFSARARQVAPDAPAPRLSQPFAAAEGGPLQVSVHGELQEFAEADGAQAMAALFATQALHGEVPGDATARSEWLLAHPLADGSTCLAGEAQAFDGEGAETGSTTAVELCGAVETVAVGDGSGDAALQIAAVPGGSASLRFEGGAPLVGYRLTTVGPDLPPQANDRARDAVGPAWRVVQPLAREAVAVDAPADPVTEAPTDG